MSGPLRGDFFLTHTVYLGKLVDLVYCMHGQSNANMSWIFIENPSWNLLEICSVRFVDTLNFENVVPGDYLVHKMTPQTQNGQLGSRTKNLDSVTRL